MKKIMFLLVAAVLLSPVFAQGPAPAPAAPAADGAAAKKMHKTLHRKRHHRHHARPQAGAVPVDAPPAGAAAPGKPEGPGKKEAKPAS